MRSLDHIDFGEPRQRAERDVSREEGVLGLDHLRPAQVADFGELGERDLRALHRHHQHLAESLLRVPRLADIAHLHRETLAPLDGGADHPASDGGLDRLMDVGNVQSVARGRIAVRDDFEIGFTDNAVRVDGFR